MKKKIIINICLVLLVIVGIEMFSFYQERNRIKKETLNQTIIKFNYKIPVKNLFLEALSEDRYFLQTTNKDKNGIIVLGCSYAQGYALNEENFAGQLSKKLDRPTMNLGFGGHGLSTLYKLFTLKEATTILKAKLPEVKHLIYVYHYDHQRRFFEKYNEFMGEVYTSYEVKKGKLVERKHPLLFLYPTFFYRHYLSGREYYKSEEEFKTYNLFNTIIKQLNIKTKELYPNSKFIILVVPTKYTAEKEVTKSTFPDWETKKLEELGLTVIDAESIVDFDMSDEKYYLEDKAHPNKLYWELLIPKITKYLEE